VHRDHLILQEKEKAEELLQDNTPDVLAPEVIEVDPSTANIEDTPLEK
jgi:hypothetical protein